MKEMVILIQFVVFFQIYSGAEIIILTLSIISALAAFVQIQKLSHSFNVPYDLDTLLSSITVTGSYIYGVFGMLASLFSISETRSVVVFVQCALLVIQVTMQGKSRRSDEGLLVVFCHSRVFSAGSCSTAACRQPAIV